MEDVEERHRLSSDRPQVHPSSDRLGYALFARHLANSINKMVPADGLVVAIYGVWGLGKSTLVNFVCHYLNELPEADRPVVVTFNPWWFSGSEDLTRRFFDQLRAELKDKPLISKDLRDGIANLADAVSKVPISIPNTPISTKILGPLSRLIRAKNVDIVELKGKISELLMKQSRKILVVIDDIDRLNTEETREMFRLVKSLADFQNTIYLLAFDRTVVASMLSKSIEGSGDSYLEKIVQVPFELPIPTKDSVTHLLTERIDQIIRNTRQDLFDERRWRGIFLSGIDHFILTPRDAVRLTNTLSVTYPAVDGEVNIVDFVAIEALRTFRPETYSVIRSQQELFACNAPDDWMSSFGRDPAKERAFHEAWLQSVPEQHRQATRWIVTRLFPRVESILADSTSSVGSRPEWRRDRRVCSPDAFPAYFRLELPLGAISAQDLRSILELTSDRYGLALRLADLTGEREPDGTTRARRVLARLADHADRDIPADAIGPTVCAMFDVGDIVVSAEEEATRWEIDSESYISQIVRRVLRRLEPHQRPEVLEDAIADGAALSTIVDVIVDLGREHGKYNSDSAEPESRRLLTTEQLEKAESLTLGRIRDWAQNGLLLEVPTLGRVLYRWRDWSDVTEPQTWVKEHVATEAGLFLILRAFQGRSSGTSGIRFFFDPKVIEPFIDPATLLHRVQSLKGRSDLSVAQATAVRTFVDGYEKRQQGKDPKSFFDD